MPEIAMQQVTRAWARLRQTEPKVHAYVHTFESQAFELARRLDEEEPRGKLYGVPFAVKEVFDVAGVETTAGCRVFAGRTAISDATVVRRLRTLGAVLMGTQVSHELTWGLDEPPTRNPWDLDRYPGGSSAGAGVSASVGSAAFTLGTDGAGSVRIPAAMTGVVGFKPSMGAVSKNGVMRGATAPSIDNVGIIAGSVALVKDVFAAIQFADPADVHSLLHRPYSFALLTGDSQELRDRRFAILGPRTLSHLDKIYQREDDIITAFAGACDRLQDSGATLVEVEIPALAQAREIVFTLFSQELAVAHREIFNKHLTDYHPQIRDKLAAALSSPLEDFDGPIIGRAQLASDVAQALASANAEVLLTPTTPRVAMRLANYQPEVELGTLVPYTCAFNLTGQPAISLPNGLNREGLPIGLQIVGHPYSDFAVLEVAAAIERILPKYTSPLY